MGNQIRGRISKIFSQGKIGKFRRSRIKKKKCDI